MLLWHQVIIYAHYLRSREENGMDSTQAKILIDSLKFRTVGGWNVEEELGFGKSAVVMRATRDGITGALKVFHPELIERYGEQKQLERIDRETSLIGSTHPNLVRIYAGGKCEETGHLFVTMEYVPYENLKTILKKVPQSAIRSIMEQLASAAMFLEEKGLVHRDIKPENIVVSEDFSAVKLLDLGVLRPFADSNLTDIDQRPFIGTLRYSSPEFLQRKESHSLEGWRSLTIYQLGAVLYDLLMQEEIFSKFSSPYSVLVEAVLHEVPEIYGDDIDLVRLCRHSLTKNPTTRFELVSWNDFKLDANIAVSTEVLRSRIKVRQKHFHDSSTNIGLGNAERLRLQKKELQDLCNRIGAAIAITLNDLDCFPLRKTVEETSFEGRIFKLLTFFETDNELGLPLHLHVAFEMMLEDHNNGNPIYSLKAGAYLSSLELTFNQISMDKRLVIGETNEVADQSIFSGYFLKCLEAAYQYTEIHGHASKTDNVALNIK